ncbi:unnamed protein product [Peronospora belbahrii]|uniref:Uncharacterized protein n=1 Tax=Peronospora belbahrii TaxID=622444 RepID=A0AAU9L967_9STRA|nr:unnamed protein product [Peronospora belbahrii]CAH0513591.1 unnamed protein product [Peronospora belbahrii]
MANSTTATMLKVCGSLLLGWLAVVYSEDSHKHLDKVFNDKENEMKQMFMVVEQQLSAAQQVAGLFVLEDAQLEMFTVETRAKLRAIEEEVKVKVEETMKEVEMLRQTAVANVTTWKKTLQGLKDATERNQVTLEKMRKEKEDKMQLELAMVQEKERQQGIEKELKLQAIAELKQLQKLERLQELDKQKMMERAQDVVLKKSIILEKKEQGSWINIAKSRELEKHMMENQCEQSEMPVVSSLGLNDESVTTEKVASFSEDAGHDAGVKRFLAWYVIAEHALIKAVATICQHFVLPVVIVIGFFLVMTVVIARFHATKQARRSRRVLYSGYPKSYGPKPHPETKHPD